MILKQGTPLSCDRRNFTNCEQCILNLVGQDLMQTDENTIEFKKEQQKLTQLKQVFDSMGLLVVTPEGQLQLMTQRGEQLLKQYFPPCTPHSLPEPLQHWLNHQISLFTSKDKVPCPCLQLRIEQAGKQLLVSLINCLFEEQYLLLLEEQKLQSFSIASLELLGLTPREAEGGTFLGG